MHLFKSVSTVNLLESGNFQDKHKQVNEIQCTCVCKALQKKCTYYVHLYMCIYMYKPLGTVEESKAHNAYNSCVKQSCSI